MSDISLSGHYGYRRILRTMVFELSCIFLLPLWLGLDGIWLAWTVAEILATILTFVLIRAYRGRYGY